LIRKRKVNKQYRLLTKYNSIFQVVDEFKEVREKKRILERSTYPKHGSKLKEIRLMLKFTRASVHQCLFLETEDMLNMRYTRLKINKILFPCLIFFNKVSCLSQENEKSLLYIQLMLSIFQNQWMVHTSLSPLREIRNEYNCSDYSVKKHLG